MDKLKIKNLRNINIDSVVWDIENVCHVRNSPDSSSYVCLIAYTLLRIRQDNSIKYDSIDNFIKSAGEPESRARYLKDTLHDVWTSIISLKEKYDEDSLLSLVLFHEADGKTNSNSTPMGISQLAAKIMDIRAGDNVADFCTGKGSFIRECMLLQPNAKYYGNDISISTTEIASIRSQILGGDINIVQEDIFFMKNEKMKFDIAFANYPFGMRAKDAWGKGFDNYKKFVNNKPDFARTVSLDWLFNDKVFSTIADSRRAVCIMTNGSTWNTLDCEARKHFISKEAVEAVIALPTNLFGSTSIGTVMIVFSKNNDSVMMVDAREICSRGRRFNTITEENVNDILDAFSTEGKYSKRISYKKIKDNNFVLYPVRYMTENIDIDNGVPFETVIKRITRGAPLNASALDNISSDIPTNIQYLMLSNIKDGIIDDELPYLKKIEPRQERYCIKNNSLIISKNGYPYKIAVAKVPDGHHVLANGNLFIIELDEEKIDPFFVKAYLESDTGIAILNSITVGATMPNIGIDQLKKITIPLLSMNKQKLISDRYLTLIDEIKLLRKKMENTTNKLKHIFSEFESP